VGRANGQNRIAIVIPCHRVVNKGGQLGGYGGGLWRKQFLLDLERGVRSLLPANP
jgi:AraC family transcriptional regulator of adaptative response/methylated-DNA-[protein]-cysteine methyltransferase